MSSGKLSIKQEMAAIDTKDRKWYDSLSAEEEKKVGIWVLMRYTSSVKHDIKEFEEHYLEFTNDIVNVNFNKLAKHPQLQFQLLQALGLGKSMWHPWIAPGKKGKSSKIAEFFKEHYKQYNDMEIELLLSQYTKDEIKQKLEEFGLDDKKIKELTK